MKQCLHPHPETSYIVQDKIHDENKSYDTSPKTESGFDVVKSIKGGIRVLRNYISEQKKDNDSHFNIE